MNAHSSSVIIEAINEQRNVRGFTLSLFAKCKVGVVCIQLFCLLLERIGLCHDCCIISGEYHDPKPIGRDEVKDRWLTKGGFYLATRRLGVSDAGEISEGAMS